MLELSAAMMFVGGATGLSALFPRDRFLPLVPSRKDSLHGTPRIPAMNSEDKAPRAAKTRRPAAFLCRRQPLRRSHSYIGDRALPQEPLAAVVDEEAQAAEETDSDKQDPPGYGAPGGSRERRGPAAGATTPMKLVSEAGPQSCMTRVNTNTPAARPLGTNGYERSPRRYPPASDGRASLGTGRVLS